MTDPDPNKRTSVAVSWQTHKDLTRYAAYLSHQAGRRVTLDEALGDALDVAKRIGPHEHRLGLLRCGICGWIDPMFKRPDDPNG